MRCRLGPFVKLARTITDQRAEITAAIRHGLSRASALWKPNARRVSRRICVLIASTRAVMIALAMLSLAALCPPLPR